MAKKKFPIKVGSKSDRETPTVSTKNETEGNYTDYYSLTPFEYYRALDDSALVGAINSQFTYAQSRRVNFEQRWQANNLDYDNPQSSITVRNPDGTTSIIYGKTQTAEGQIVSNIQIGLAGSNVVRKRSELTKKLFEFTSRTLHPDDGPKAEIGKALIEDQLRKIDFQNKIRKQSYNTATKESESIVKVDWEKLAWIVEYLDDKKSEIGSPKYRRSIKRIDQLCMYVVDNRFFFTDPLALTLNDAVWTLEVQIMDFDEFRVRYWDNPNYIQENVKKVRPYVEGRVPQWRTIQEQALNKYLYQTGILGYNQVAIFHYYNKEADYYTCMAMYEVLYRGPNPYQDKELPYYEIHNDIPDKTFYTQGEPEIVRPHAVTMNSMINLKIENAKYQIPIMVYRSNSAIKNKVMAAIPGVLNSIDGDPSEIKSFTAGGQTPDAAELINLVQDLATSRNGIDPRDIIDTAPDTTATQELLQKESRNIILNDLISFNEANGMARMLRLVWSRIQQFALKKKVYRNYMLDDQEIQLDEFEAELIKDAKQQGIKKIDKYYDLPNTFGKNVEFDANSKFLKWKEDSGVDNLLQVRPEWLDVQIDFMPIPNGILDDIDDKNKSDFNAITQLIAGNPAIAKVVDWNAYAEKAVELYPIAEDFLIISKPKTQSEDPNFATDSPEELLQKAHMGVTKLAKSKGMPNQKQTPTSIADQVYTKANQEEQQTPQQLPQDNAPIPSTY